MSLEDNKNIASDYFKAFVANDHAWMDEHIAEDFLRNDPGLDFEVRGPEGVKELGRVLLGAFSDMELDVQDRVAEGDKVLMRLILRATHAGEFAGIQATGRKVEIDVMDLFKIQDGKLVEQWALLDGATLMAQLQEG